MTDFLDILYIILILWALVFLSSFLKSFIHKIGLKHPDLQNLTNPLESALTAVENSMNPTEISETLIHLFESEQPSEVLHSLADVSSEAVSEVEVDASHLYSTVEQSFLELEKKGKV